MHIDSLKSYVGQVVVLDLVMGKEITTKINAVNESRGTVLCYKARVFVPVPDQTGNLNIITLEYGHPLYHADDVMEIDAAHVFQIFRPSQDQIDAWTRNTSGIVPASASTLDQLKGIDMSKLTI